MMQIDELTVPKVNAALREIQQVIKPLSTGTIDLASGRITNAGAPIGQFDYVRLFDLTKALSGLPSVPAKTATATTGLLSTFTDIRWGLYANRGAVAPHANTVYLASDRSYIAFLSTGSKWVYYSGVHRDVLSNQPTPTSDETNYAFDATDTAQHFWWTGTAWVEEYEIDDSGTTTSPSILNLIHRSSGTPAANFGGSLYYYLDSAAKTQRLAGYLALLWSVATDGAETADFIVGLRKAGAAAAETFRVRGSDGGILATGKIIKYSGANPSDGQLLIGDTGNGTFNANTVTAGTGIAIANGAGTVTVSIAATNYPRVSETVALTNQGADVTTTAFAASSTAGTYRCSYYLVDSTADVAAGTVTATFAFTDAAGATTVVSAAVSLTGIGTLRTSGVFFIQLASGSITYAVAHTGIFGTSKYALYATLERLS